MFIDHTHYILLKRFLVESFMLNLTNFMLLSDRNYLKKSTSCQINRPIAKKNNAFRITNRLK